MESRGGCCIARYTDGTGSSYGMSKVDQIMLKFRPIAPKPVAAGSVCGSSTTDNSDGYGGTRRGKRKYVRTNSYKRKNTRSDSKKTKVSTSSSSVSDAGDAAVTLSLWPETPDLKENSPVSANSDLSLSTNCTKPKPIGLSFNDFQQPARDDHAVAMTQAPQLISYVTVERVTDTCTAMNVEMDTCPAFITDGGDRVVWMNKAYREMVVGGGSEEVVVMLARKDKVTVSVSHPAFTCRVKVTWGSERGSSPSTLTAPCDVWRLGNSGFAWRLDVKAALCLGLGKGFA